MIHIPLVEKKKTSKQVNWQKPNKVILGADPATVPPRFETIVNDF